MNRKDLGNQGEAVAKKLIKKQGFKILEENYSSKWGEIDLIAKEKDTIVFIEVRSKSVTGYGRAQETVDREKQRKIRRTAEQYLVAKGWLDQYCRFDVVAIQWDGKKYGMEQIKDAFI